MKKRYYFDRSNGIFLLLGLLFLILPLTVIMSVVCAGVFLWGIEFFIFGVVDIWYRIFFGVLLIAAPVFFIIGFVKLFIILVKGICFFLHFVKVDKEGVTCSLFGFVRKHWRWDEIVECGLGWDFDRVAKDNKPLPEGREKFVLERGKYLRTERYIFFSTKRLSETEKSEIFYGQQKKDYLIAVKYSSILYEYLRSTGRLVCNEELISEQLQKEELLKGSTLIPKDEIKMKMFADKKTGVFHFITMLMSLYIAVYAVVCIKYYELSYRNILFFAFLVLIALSLIGGVIFFKRFLMCLRKITVDCNEVRVKLIFGKESSWTWREIVECGVIRDNSPHLMLKGLYRDQRYIFFSKIPLYLDPEKSLVQQFNREYVIFVIYSEELYLYLNEMGVFND